MSAVTGKVAVVTGAGSGIGRALALELAGRGARLALCDVDPVGLEETARLVERTSPDPFQEPVDVSDREAVAAFAGNVGEHFGVVHQVYNNAGIAYARPLLESDYADYERVLGVNLWGVIHGTKEFLPHLVASGDGHVVNVSSLNGILAQERMTHYCTSKFGVRGFTEALRIELLSEKVPVGVTCVHPGGVRTAIADNALAKARELGLPVTEDDERRRALYNKRFLRLDPAAAARTVVDGVERGRSRVMVGNDARLLDGFVRAMPALYQRLSASFGRRVTG